MGGILRIVESDFDQSARRGVILLRLIIQRFVESARRISGRRGTGSSLRPLPGQRDLLEQRPDSGGFQIRDAMHPALPPRDTVQRHSKNLPQLSLREAALEPETSQVRASQRPSRYHGVVLAVAGTAAGGRSGRAGPSAARFLTTIRCSFRRADHIRGERLE